MRLRDPPGIQGGSAARAPAEVTLWAEDLCRMLLQVSVPAGGRLGLSEQTRGCP